MEPKLERVNEMAPKHRERLEWTERVCRPFFQRAAIVFRNKTNSHFIGSGTLVEYRGRVWLATAAHVIEVAEGLGLARTGICWKLVSEDGPYAERMLGDLAVAWRPSESADVAAVLLRKDVHLEKATAIPEEQLNRNVTPVVPQDYVWLVGAPLAITTRVRNAAGPDAQALVITTTHIKECPVELHAQDKCGEYSRPASLDFHVDWSVGSEAGGQYAPMVDPSGLSGGPLYVAGSADGEVWSRERIRLAGIAWYWNAEASCIRAVPVGEWFLAADRTLGDALASGV